MSPTDVARALERCELSPGAFGHRAHVQAAWFYLDRYGFKEGRRRFVGALHGFIDHVGAHDKYHETLTQALLCIIDSRRRPGESWSDFEGRDRELFENAMDLVGEYYSSDILASEEARRQFLEPNRSPLPLALGSLV